MSTFKWVAQVNNSLLPPSATPQERALEEATYRMADIPVAIRDTWNPCTCPTHLLPWLAWAFSVDEWDARWSEEAQRETIRNATTVHRHKGTIWSIKKAISDAGYADSTLLEGNGNNRYDGTQAHNGYILHGDPSAWAAYRFVLSRPITNEQARQVRRILAYTAPARCHLIQLIFSEAANIYNAAITHDGTYNHGAA
jgi:phage tail P2-like protein